MSSISSFRAQFCINSSESSDSESDDSGTYWSITSTNSLYGLEDKDKDDPNKTKLDLADHVPPNSTHKSIDKVSEKSHKLEQELAKTIKVLEEKFTQERTQRSILQNQLKEMRSLTNDLLVENRLSQIENKELKENIFDDLHSMILGLNSDLEDQKLDVTLCRNMHEMKNQLIIQNWKLKAKEKIISVQNCKLKERDKIISVQNCKLKENAKIISEAKTQEMKNIQEIVRNVIDINRLNTELKEKDKIISAQNCKSNEKDKIISEAKNQETKINQPKTRLDANVKRNADIVKRRTHGACVFVTLDEKEKEKRLFFQSRLITPSQSIFEETKTFNIKFDQITGSMTL